MQLFLFHVIALPLSQFFDLISMKNLITMINGGCIVRYSSAICRKLITQIQKPFLTHAQQFC